MKAVSIALLTVFLFTVPTVSSAHEFILIPEQWQTYRVGQAVPLSVYSTHVFARSEELEPEGYTELSYNGAALPLTANAQWLTYDGTVEPKAPGTAIIAGHRKAMLYEGTQYEKFAKLLLPVGGKTDGYDKVLGQRLELVPMSDPFAAKVGDEISFRVLLDGKPAAIDMVYATFDGFSDIPSAYAFCAAPVSHGEARIQITAPGTWIVRVSVALDEAGKDYKAVDLKSVLTFPVR